MSDSALCKVSSSEFAKVLGCQAIDFSVLCPSTLFETRQTEPIEDKTTQSI